MNYLNSILKKAFINEKENKECMIFNSSAKEESSSKNLNIALIVFLE
jgi:hypothetical protein